jgi:hypothetical protein
MKFAILSTALLGTAFTQYVFPSSTGSASLPSEPKGIEVVTTHNLDVTVPTFPNANLFTLHQGSINGKVTAANINRNIRSGQQ